MEVRRNIIRGKVKNNRDIVGAGQVKGEEEGQGTVRSVREAVRKSSLVRDRLK